MSRPSSSSSSLSLVRLLARVLAFVATPFILSSCFISCRGDEDPEDRYWTTIAKPNGISLKPGGARAVDVQMFCNRNDCGTYAPGWWAGSNHPDLFVTGLDADGMIVSPTINYTGPEPEPGSLFSRSAQFTFSFTPSKEPPPKQGKKPDGATVRVNIKPTVEKPEIEEPSPGAPSLTKTLQHGLFAGASTREVSFFYNGPGPATVTITTVKDAGFNITGPAGTVTVQPGHELKFNVQFSTTGDTEQKASIEVKIDDATTSTMDFTGRPF